MTGRATPVEVSFAQRPKHWRCSVYLDGSDLVVSGRDLEFGPAVLSFTSDDEGNIPVRMHVPWHRVHAVIEDLDL